MLFQNVLNTFWASADTAFVSFAKGQFANVQKVDDPVITDLYIKERSELDPAKRAALIWQFEQYEMEQLYVIRMSFTINFNVKWRFEINGASHDLATNPTPPHVAMLDPTKAPTR